MLKWIGNTKGVECWYTIPARDLTAKEVKQHGGEKTLLATGLYATPEDDPVKITSKPLMPDNTGIEVGSFKDIVSRGIADDK